MGAGGVGVRDVPDDELGLMGGAIIPDADNLLYAFD